MAKRKERAKGEGNGEEADEAQGKEQLRSIVDWPKTEERLPREEAKNGEECVKQPRDNGPGLVAGLL